MAAQNVKYLAIKLTTYVWGLWAESCQTLMRGFKEDLNIVERDITLMDRKTQYCYVNFSQIDPKQ